jgi:hypothetical protein
VIFAASPCLPGSNLNDLRVCIWVCAVFRVSDASFNYEEAAKYCEGKSMTLASIYTAEELAEARAAIKAKGIDKAITSAFADGAGWKWREKTEYWTYERFPLNTGKVTDQADPKVEGFVGMYSLHGDGDFVWDADGREEKHPALCRVEAPSPVCDGDSRPFMLADTWSILCVSNAVYPSRSVADCVLNKTWDQLISMQYVSNVHVPPYEPLFYTGSLGESITKGVYETWVCVLEHPCVEDKNDMPCFTYNEMQNTFVPWGLNSDLHMVRPRNYRPVAHDHHHHHHRTVKRSSQGFLHQTHRARGTF